MPIASVKCGEFHTVALTTDGEVWAWGNGEMGRLGNGENDNFEVPVPMEYFAEDNIVQIACGRDFSFAINEDGELYGWGSNNRMFVYLFPWIFRIWGDGIQWVLRIVGCRLADWHGYRDGDGHSQHGELPGVG